MVGRHGGRSRADAQPDLQPACHLGPDRGHPDGIAGGTIPPGRGGRLGSDGRGMGNTMMLRLKECAVAGNIGGRKEPNRNQVQCL